MPLTRIAPESYRCAHCADGDCLVHGTDLDPWDPDKEARMDTPAALDPYEGHDVLTATVSIRNTGDGLSQAMSVDPVKLALGSTVYVVLECETEKHRYEEVKDAGGALQLVNMLKAGRATIVDAELVRKHLDDQQRRIDEAEGQPQLPMADEERAAPDEPRPIGDELDNVLSIARDAEEQAGYEPPADDGDEAGEQ